MKTLRELRAEAGYTQRVVAEYVGTTVTSVWYWEASRARPNEANLCKLAELYDTPVEEIEVAPFRSTGRQPQVLSEFRS